MAGVLTRVPKSSQKKESRKAVAALTMKRLAEDLAALLPESPHSLAVVDHALAGEPGLLEEVDESEFKAVTNSTPAPRRAAAVGNLAAVRAGRGGCR